MTTPPRTPTTAAGRRLLAGYGHVQSTDGPPNEEPPWCAADDEPWPCPFSQNILDIEAEALAAPDHAPLDVDRSKACPLDLDCYRFQGHPGEHMYA
jgi:hypothetical protein